MDPKKAGRSGARGGPQGQGSATPVLSKETHQAGRWPIPFLPAGKRVLALLLATTKYLEELMLLGSGVLEFLSRGVSRFFQS